MRNLHRWGDNVPTITLGLAISADDLAAAQGKRFHLAIPLAGLFFDDRPGVAARFGFICDVALNGAAAASGVLVSRIPNTSLGGLTSDFDPRSLVRQSVDFMVEVAADANAFGATPLVIYGVAVASEAGDALPAGIATNENVFTLTDRAGGGLSCFAQEIFA